jgi:hypothetical protein
MKNSIAMLSDIHDLIKPLYPLKSKVEQLETELKYAIDRLEVRITKLEDKKENEQSVT